MSGMGASFLPRILNFEEEEVLVPIKIDIAHGNGRYMDSFCWNLYNSVLTPEEFVWKTCMEENLPSELIPRIAAQLQEQVDAFLSFVDLIISSGRNEHIQIRLNNLETDVSVRCNVVEYSDSFQWDAYTSTGCDPEAFAKQTCLDLGLPCEMQSVIALRLRESIIRWERLPGISYCLLSLLYYIVTDLLYCH
jgi:chromatin structure-remodeling complex subunit SFH1